jgi:hypothetical protein
MNCAPNVFTIFTGDAKSMQLKAVYADGLDPLDLTNCTEISIALPLAIGGLTDLLLSLGQVVITSPPILGKFSAAISSGLSQSLNVGELQNFDVTFTISGITQTVRFSQALTVIELN